MLAMWKTQRYPQLTTVPATQHRSGHHDGDDDDDGDAPSSPGSGAWAWHDPHPHAHVYNRVS